MELLKDDATRFLKVEKTKLDAEPKEHAEDGGRRRSGAGSGSSCWSSWSRMTVRDGLWTSFGSSSSRSKDGDYSAWSSMEAAFWYWFSRYKIRGISRKALTSGHICI